MIYDEAFEVNVDSLSFLAFSRFDTQDKAGVKMNVSHCGESQLGWYRHIDRSQWGCFYARKSVLKGPAQASLLSFLPGRPASPNPDHDQPLPDDYHTSFATSLNLMQDWWTAHSHSKWLGKTLRELNRMAGIFRSLPVSEQQTSGQAQSVPSLLQRGMVQNKATLRSVKATELAPELPDAWDWRNVSGMNYLDKVLDQGDCGSCYAVATTRMLTVRHRIKQANPSAEAFSISFPLHCSEYTQGCDGGYAFLVSRWSQDVGLVPKSCSPYRTSGGCALKCSSPAALERRWRADNHRYVGGYYGGSSEHEMMRELVENGPLVASFEPKADLMYYHGGVYTTVPNQRSDSGWERVDHAVLLVGFGEERGRKYWILQNSWGTHWGEAGFFRMARGTDESGIESIVVAAEVVEDDRPSVLMQFASSL
jgi:cathepsin C